MTTLSRFVVVQAVLASICSAAAAQSTAIPPEIRRQVTAGVAAQWGVAPPHVAVDWESAVVAGAVPWTPDSMQLRGDGMHGWFLVVIGPGLPVSRLLRVRAGRVVSRPVAARRLRRDDVLEPADIAYVTDTVYGPPPVEDVLLGQPGWRVRRNLRVGAPLIPPMVMPPPLIELGRRDPSGFDSTRPRMVPILPVGSPGIDTLTANSIGPTRVIIDQHDGSVSTVGIVTLRAATVRHNGIAVSIGAAAGVASPDGVVAVPAGVSAHDIAAGLHAAGAQPRELAAIFDLLRQAGALDATVEIE